MKAKFSQFIFILLICFSFFSFNLSQTKFTALKFDEFGDSSNDQLFEFNEINLSQRIERLAKQVKKQRGVKVYIIYYRARQLNDQQVNKAENWAGRTEYTVTYEANLKFEDVVSINGGYKERNTLEYWIAPKNAAPPKSSPTFDKSEAVVCKEVRVFSDTDRFNNYKTINFSAGTSFTTETGEAFRWKVSAGEITAGQGTNKITVDLKNVDDKHITASAEIDGLPFSCPKVGYTTVNLIKKPIQIDSAVRYNYSDLSARMEALRIALSNDPISKGYIIIYANRERGATGMERAIRSVKRIFSFLGLNPNRYTIIKGGYRDYDTVDTWLLQPGDTPPQPSPTVDSRFINFSKQTKKAVRRK
jgi:hypothetical protein